MSVSRSCRDVVICCCSPPRCARSKVFAGSEGGWGGAGARPDPTGANGCVGETSLAFDLQSRRSLTVEFVPCRQRGQFRCSTPVHAICLGFRFDGRCGVLLSATCLFARCRVALSPACLLERRWVSTPTFDVLFPEKVSVPCRCFGYIVVKKMQFQMQFREHDKTTIR